MDNFTKSLLAIIVQHLDKNKFPETARMLEQESAIFFNVKHFEEKIIAGEWRELEKYLLGFTKIDENRFSIKIFFEIRKQKYLEALDRNEKARAVEILRDLKFFASYDEDVYQEMSSLLTMENFREHTQLRGYVDAQTARIELVTTLKPFIEANPNFRQKHDFPSISSETLVTMLNQSHNMQHSLCENWRAIPEMETLFTDHFCKPLNANMASTSSFVPSATVASRNAYLSLGLDSFFQNSGASSSGNGAALLQKPAAATATCMPEFSNQVLSSKRLRSPQANLRTTDYQKADHERFMKRMRSALLFNEAGPSSFARETSSTFGVHVTHSLNDLPRIVACNLQQGSAVMSLDFHPTRHTLLLVGSANGEVALWELRTEQKIVSKPFMIRNLNRLSSTFQAIFARNRNISVIRALWSPDGCFIGVAFNKHLIHLFAYPGSYDLQQILEVEAHSGLVNDLAFVHPHGKLCIATCGDDKLVKVWNFNGQRLYYFEGHQAPIYSICPSEIRDTQFLMSISVDGKVKGWFYDDLRSRVDFVAPGLWCSTFRYNDDRNRLFSCGTSRQGESFLVEWREDDLKEKRVYCGLSKKPAGTVLHFDTTQNKYLAVGEDNQIKFWDMNNVEVLTNTHAEGGLPSQARLRFNKEGNLLAVSTIGNGFKILATAASLRSLRSVETSAFKAISSSAAAILSARDSSAPVLGSSVSAAINLEDSNEGKRNATKQTVTRCEDEPMPINNGNSTTLQGIKDKIQPWQLAEITHPDQCQKITVPQGDNVANKVLRMVYTHSGSGLLALGSNGILNVWKWQSNDENPGAKATTRVLPQQWKPKNPCAENVMINEPGRGERLNTDVPCLTLSRNDYFAISVYGADVSLFNVDTFEQIVPFNAPPPVSTCVVFYPVNDNIVAVGLDDSTISIYEVKEDVEIAILKGHTRGITGLSFSTNLKVLVSSGGDGVLCAWDTNLWTLIKSAPVIMSAVAPVGGETGVQFHPNDLLFLVTQQRMLAVYDAFQMKRVNEWLPRVVHSAPITCATYSGDGQLVYASLENGSVWVLEANTLKPRCHVASSAYWTVVPGTNGGEAVYPLTVAAHPQERNQFALGLSNGSIKVIEPLASEGEWGKSPPSD